MHTVSSDINGDCCWFSIFWSTGVVSLVSQIYILNEESRHYNIAFICLFGRCKLLNNVVMVPEGDLFFYLHIYLLIYYIDTDNLGLKVPTLY